MLEARLAPLGRSKPARRIGSLRAALNDSPDAARVKLRRLSGRSGFAVTLSNGRAQAAAMNIKPGGAEGGPDNRHRGADQWLYVIEGTGAARVNRRHIALRRGSLLLIERGDEHQISNTGPGLLRTLNVYVPPAYTKRGDELSRAKP
jgi:mannose-6-phosphate isomerase-like protein (cupin superfamily)